MTRKEKKNHLLMYEFSWEKRFDRMLRISCKHVTKFDNIPDFVSRFNSLAYKIIFFLIDFLILIFPTFVLAQQLKD
jgi:hypothetical protein